MYLRRKSRGQISLELALFLLTEQPALLAVPPSLLLQRIKDLALALDLRLADIADYLSQNIMFISVLPFRLRRQVEALANALEVGEHALLTALANNFALLDAAPLLVRRRVEALAAQLGLGFEHAAQLVIKCPEVLDVDPDSLLHRAQALVDVLGVGADAAWALLSAEPRVLLVDSALLAHNVHSMARLAGMEVAAWQRWLCQCPLLLLIPADVLHERLLALTDLLQDDTLCGPALQEYVAVDARVLLCPTPVLGERLVALPRVLEAEEDVALQLARSCATYLALETGELELRLEELRFLLQMSLEQARSVAQCPEVFLRVSAEVLLSRLRALVAGSGKLTYRMALELAGAVPQVLSREPSEVLQRLDALSASLAMDQRDLVQTVVRMPSLLLQPAEALARVSQVARSLEVESSDMGALLLHDPDVVDALPHFGGGVEALTSCHLCDASTAARVLKAVPELLSHSSQVLTDTCRRLLDASECCSGWHGEMQELRGDPAALARCLCNAVWRLPRLEYLLDSGTMHFVGLAYALNAPLSRFTADFLEYRQWSRANGLREGGDEGGE